MPHDYSYQGIVVAPSKESVRTFIIGKKPKVDLENLSIMKIDGVNVDLNFEVVSELELI